MTKVKKLPKNPVKGKEYTRTVNAKGNLGKRDITYKATGKKGFGKYKITKNVKA